MSFYYGNKVKSVDGINIYEAVTNALADLHEDFRENASIYMKYADYINVVSTLANGSTPLYEAQPEKYLVNQLFLQMLTHPVVGDFNYFGINYNSTTFDTDKDVTKGEYLFVLTAWYDQQRTLDSAFRIANVTNKPL